MSARTITSTAAEAAHHGSRGETDLVAGPGYSMHSWNLEGMAPGDAHSNAYDVAIYINAGSLSVWDANETETTLGVGDSILIPTGVDYSMGTESAQVVEFRMP